MQCPKCHHEFEVVYHDGVEVDRCTHCFGIWFDHLEQDDLKKLKGSSKIDIGDEFVGARYDDMANVPCPRCVTNMSKVVHQASVDITFERCTSCHGSFFDAGEFRDYLEDEIMQEFSDVLGELDDFEPQLTESGDNLVDK